MHVLEAAASAASGALRQAAEQIVQSAHASLRSEASRGSRHTATGRNAIAVIAGNSTASADQKRPPSCET